MEHFSYILFTCRPRFINAESANQVSCMSYFLCMVRVRVSYGYDAMYALKLFMTFYFWRKRDIVSIILCAYNYYIYFCTAHE